MRLLLNRLNIHITYIKCKSQLLHIKFCLIAEIDVINRFIEKNSMNPGLGWVKAFLNHIGIYDSITKAKG